MEQIMSQIWPPLLGALLTAIGLYAGYIRKLIVDVAVLQKEVENQQTIINNMTKRLDAHSKKQDEILNALTRMEVELVKQIGQANSGINVLTSDIKNLKSLLSITEEIKNNHKK